VTIRKRLLLSSAISTALAAAVLATILYSSREIAAQNRNRTAFHQILKAVSELDILTYEYVLHHEERARQQWRLVHESLRSLLAATGGAEEEDTVIVAGLTANADVIANAFSHAVSSHELRRKLDREDSPQEQIAAAAAVEDRWIAQLMIASQAMISDASILSERGAARLLRTQSHVRNLAVFITLVLVGGILIMSLAVTRFIASALRRLHEGTERIGRGDLDYRIALDSRDEFGDLARAFDGMSDRLKETTVSRDKLAAEVKARMEAEEAARAGEARMRAVFGALVEGIVFLNLRGEVVEINDAVQRHHGQSLDELWGPDIDPRGRIIRSDGTPFPVEDQPAMLALRTGEVVRDVEMGVPLQDGSTRWWLVNAQPVRDDRGNILGAVASFFDITERMRIEQALRESEEKYRNLFENMTEEVHFWQLVRDGNGKIETWRLVDANPPTLKSWGRQSVEEIRGRTTDEIFGPGSSEHYMNVVQKIFTEGVPYSFEDYFPNLDRHFQFTSVPLGEYFITTGADISAVKKTQEALRRSEARWNAAIENFAGGAIIATEDEQVIYWNPAAREMHGFTRPDEGIEPLEKTPATFQLWTPDGRRMLELDEWPMRRIKRGEAVRNMELRIRRPDQSWEKVFSYSGAMVDTAGGERLIFLSCYDLTDLRRAEQALRRTAEELRRSNEDLRQFAYISSHDLQEPLRMVNSFLKLLDMRYKQQLDEKARGYINFAVEGATRMSHLIYDLLDYSRLDRQRNQPEPADSGQALTGALDNLSNAIRESGAKVTFDELPTVMADRSQLMLLFQNLIGNAIKFRAPDRPCLVNVSARKTDDGWEFAVRDNGIGIVEASYERIFVIFQRLHAREKYDGTGIGLAICKKIVEQAGGRIWVESKEGEGATFFFTLPQEVR
jgi:PAS domain S-box-containing protein